jgi:hypothetical protein
MTPFEKLLLGLIALYFLSHAIARWGAEAALPAGAVALAERIVTI